MARKLDARLRTRSKALSLDLTKWVEEARGEDLITLDERDEFMTCAERIAEIGGLFG